VPRRDLARHVRDGGDDRVEVLFHPVVGGVDELQRAARDGQGRTLVVEQGALHDGRPGVDAEPGARHDRAGTVCP
jgi:hypothetical protein